MEKYTWAGQFENSNEKGVIHAKTVHQAWTKAIKEALKKGDFLGDNLVSLEVWISGTK